MAYKNSLDPRNRASRLRHYYKNKETYIARNKIRRQRLRTEKTQYVIDYFKEHPCVDCSESDVIVLDFDHVKGTKIASISKFIITDAIAFSLTNMIEEMKKCVVRCANCHRRKTAREGKHLRFTLGEN